MLDLITIGDALIDTHLILDDSDANIAHLKEGKKLCFNYAEKIAIKDSTHSIGGNAANVAVGTTKLGLSTAIVTELGDDLAGHAIDLELSKAGVDTQMVKLLKAKETRYSVVLNYHAERTILSYHAERNYRLPALATSRWIYYTSLGKTFEGIHKPLLAHLKKHEGVKLAMNPGSFQFSHGLPHIKRLLPAADLLILNKEEAVRLVGKKNHPRDILKSIIKEYNTPLVVLTDGTNGSYAADSTFLWHMLPYPVRAIAKTGAGDAYTSGFLSALIKNKDVYEAMRWGTANAAGVVQQFGSQTGLLKQTQLIALIKKYPKILPTAL